MPSAASRDTTSRGRTRWYLDSRTASRPEPLFKGELYQSRTRLVRFAVVGGQNTFIARLEVRLDPRPDGGTALTGWIGMPAGAFSATLLIGAGGVVSLSLLATGIVQLALGHLIGLVPALLFPLPAAAFAGFFALGHRSLESDIAELVQQVKEVLGSSQVVDA